MGAHSATYLVDLFKWKDRFPDSEAYYDVMAVAGAGSTEEPSCSSVAADAARAGWVEELVCPPERYQPVISSFFE